MKKVFILLIFGILLISGCSEETSKEEGVETSDNNVNVESEENDPEPEPEEEVPIHPDEIKADITIREPDSIGTVYMDATYTNNTEYPIVAYQLNVLLKDKNEKVNLVNFDTVMPGETSTKFDSFGPETQDPNDYELLGLEVTARTEDNKDLYIEYDFKLEEAEWWVSEE